VNRRRRLLATAGAAVVAAVTGVVMVSGYAESVTDRFGPLRSVVVTTRPIESGRTLTLEILRDSTEVRRIPARFVPAGALTLPTGAIGLEAAVGLPPGAYLASGMLRTPGRMEGRPGSRSIAGLHPVEVTVQGAGAIPPGGGRFDVLVTPLSGAGTRRTRVVSRSAAIVSRSPGDPSETGTTSARVTLAVSRSQAIRLIDAEARGERLTLLATGPR
jgi:hypothetical protein